MFDWKATKLISIILWTNSLSGEDFSQLTNLINKQNVKTEGSVLISMTLLVLDEVMKFLNCEQMSKYLITLY